jgi:hypothetical protein
MFHISAVDGGLIHSMGGSEMSMPWYYSVGVSKYGPISSSELKRIAATGKLWGKSLAGWVPAFTANGLLPAGPAQASSVAFERSRSVPQPLDPPFERITGHVSSVSSKLPRKASLSRMPLLIAAGICLIGCVVASAQNTVSGSGQPATTNQVSDPLADEVKQASAYLNGDGVPKNEETAFGLFSDAAQKGSVDGMALLGYCYVRGTGTGQDFKQAMRWFHQAADKGDANAMGNIGVMYEYGDGVTQDFAQAGQWYQKASDAGDTQAMSRLGNLYVGGKGFPQDYGQAMTWYRKAADGGDAAAQFSLGRMYLKGVGVTKDIAEANKWFRKAELQGYQLNMLVPETKFDAVGLSDVVDFLRDLTNANIFVNWSAFKAAGVDVNTPITGQYRDIPLSNVLDAILKLAGSGKAKLAFALDDGVIVISTEDDIKAHAPH